jgi:hypothetical protein
MADYECYPLWEGDGPGNVDPSSLDISGDLAVAITAWGGEYDATLDRENPAASGFADQPAAEAWLRRGAQLAARLRGEGMATDYFHDGKPASDLVARR